MFGAFDLRHQHRDALGRRPRWTAPTLRGHAHILWRRLRRARSTARLEAGRRLCRQRLDPNQPRRAGLHAVDQGWLRKDEEPNEIEMAYIRFFAGEVRDFLVTNHQVEE